MQYQIFRHTLKFKFKAGTSRGVLTDKPSWFIKIFEENDPETYGLGEIAPLKGLSEDYHDQLEIKIREFAEQSFGNHLPANEVLNRIPLNYPSIRFGFETAIKDFQNGGSRKIFDCEFFDHSQPIPINGLVWMGDKKFMLEQVKSKLDHGFDVIKMKVGAICFEEELELIKYIRKHFSSDQITIRLDANGAFDETNVFEILNRFSEYHIHSIEQPVKQKQPDLMKKVCTDSPIPIALDEELIGIHEKRKKEELLAELQPQYIILKPTLTGGISGSEEWIDIAEKQHIGWWMTSLLESNIGLNAIAQFTSYKKASMPQGLGTGQLYHNNIPSPLKIFNGELMYNKKLPWDMKMVFANPV